MLRAVSTVHNSPSMHLHRSQICVSSTCDTPIPSIRPDAGTLAPTSGVWKHSSALSTQTCFFHILRQRRAPSRGINEGLLGLPIACISSHDALACDWAANHTPPTSSTRLADGLYACASCSTASVRGTLWGCGRVQCDPDPGWAIHTGSTT